MINSVAVLRPAANVSGTSFPDAFNLPVNTGANYFDLSNAALATPCNAVLINCRIWRSIDSGIKNSSNNYT